MVDGKADFTQDHHDSCMDYCNGVLQCRKEIGLNHDYNMGKWEFVAKEQDEGQWIENY